MFKSLENLMDHAIENELRHITWDVLVTPKMAKNWVENMNYDGQRLLKDQNVKILSEALRRGRFRDFSDIHFATDGDGIYLINGQHTLRSIESAKKNQHLCVHLYIVECDNEIETLYSTFDIGRKRSLRDSMGALGEELNFTPTMLNKLGPAIKSLNCKFANIQFSSISGTVAESHKVKIMYENYDHEFVKDLMRQWAAEAKQYFDAISGTPNKWFFERSDVLAIGLLTFKYHPVMAIDFWSAASSDDGLKQGDPRKSMVDWLRNNQVRRNPLQHRAAIACWNAYFNNRDLKKVYPDTDASLSLAGTDFVCAG